MTNQDIDTVARTIWGEDRGDGPLGMIAVANVIANRVTEAKYWIGKYSKPHPLFGDGTFTDCCRCPEQFSCWNADDPNLEKLQNITDDDSYFAKALGIAEQAVNGKLPDITHGATSYYAKSMKEPPYWANNKIACADIGAQLYFSNV